MKRPIVIIGIGILLLFGLSVMVSGERVVSDNKKPVTIQEKKQPESGGPPLVLGRQTADRKPTVRLRRSGVPSTGGVGADEDIGRPQAVSATEMSPDADYQIPWQSVNAGGDDRSSVSYRVLFSVGQAVSGSGTSDNYQAGMGFWYGASGTYCDCGTWGDVSGDGNVNPVDVVFMVNKVYLSNDMLVQHPNCCNPPGNCYNCGDVNCDTNVNPVDVVFFVNKVYLTNDMFCPDPCL